MAYNFTFSDKDVDVIDQQAKDFTQQFSDSSNTDKEYEPRPYVSYMSEGTYTFRIYPDRDKRGFARLSRRIWTHRSLPVGVFPDGNYRRLWGIWSDKRIDGILKELRDKGMTRLTKVAELPLWRYESQSNHIVCLHMFESSDPKYNPPNATYYVQLNDGQQFALQNWVNHLHPEDKRIILDPNNDKAPGIRMSVTKVSKKNVVNVDQAGMRPLPLPMPPKIRDAKAEDVFHDFTGLDEIVITEKDTISDADFDGFRKIMYEELAEFTASSGPPKDTTKLGYKLPSKEAPDSGRSSMRDELEDEIPF
jgi:hypothetical protein